MPYVKQFFTVFLFFLSLLSSTAFSQGGTWVWMNGNNAFNAPAVYGTQGTANSNNTPGGLYQASNWQDGAGNFWIFGGVCSPGGYASDLWKYDVDSNVNVTWVKGPGQQAQAGVYGTMGLAFAK